MLDQGKKEKWSGVLIHRNSGSRQPIELVTEVRNNQRQTFTTNWHGDIRGSYRLCDHSLAVAGLGFVVGRRLVVVMRKVIVSIRGHQETLPRYPALDD